MLGLGVIDADIPIDVGREDRNEWLLATADVDELSARVLRRRPTPDVFLEDVDRTVLRPFVRMPPALNTARLTRVDERAPA